MGTKTVKFGGSSLADAGQFQKAAAIIRQDKDRKYVIVSAPGKRYASDIKITDSLYACYAQAAAGADFSDIFSQVEARYREIIEQLGLSISLEEDFAEIRRTLAARPQPDYAASRGEFLNAKLMAAYLGWPYLDTAGCILFDANGVFNADKTQAVFSARLKEVPRAVIPGFYGSMPDGAIHTFSRGGSDITGAIVARASKSDVYENWTDVPGILMTDPRIVENPKPIRLITYSELRELAYMGASVMHEDTIFPVKIAGIPINIRNTNDPDAPGTMIVRETKTAPLTAATGIAGRTGFSTIFIEKDQMNSQLGFGRKVLSVLEHNRIPFEHMPSSIDTLSVIVPTAALDGKQEAVIQQLHAAVDPDVLTIEGGLALIAVVGRGMVRQKGTAGRLFGAISKANVNIRMIDQGSSELDILLGVDDADYETAIRAIYQEFA